MTHIDNLASIIEFGLVSHNEARERRLQKRDISFAEVQMKRHAKQDPVHGRNLHDYVCLYFTPRNPMLYVRQDQQADIVILGIERELLLEQGTLFTDGNAAAQSTAFYDRIDALGKLDWGLIEAEFWTDYPDGRRRRCAEVLVPQTIAPDHIRRIYCADRDQYERVTTVARAMRTRVCIRPQLFFDQNHAPL